jgi:hypothetical protein
MSTNELKGQQTPGPWRFGLSDYGHYGSICDCGPWIENVYAGSPEIMFGSRDESEMRANAALIAEAGTVAHETGMWPREMADALRDAEAALEELVSIVDAVRAAYYMPDSITTHPAKSALAKIAAARGEKGE